MYCKIGKDSDVTIYANPFNEYLIWEKAPDFFPGTSLISICKSKEILIQVVGNLQVRGYKIPDYAIEEILNETELPIEKIARQIREYKSRR